MKSLLTLMLTFGLALSLFAQSPGDTVVVETFNYTQTYGINQWSPGIRDTTITFPNDPNISYEKILMLYNMRCKNANVSTGANRDLGCGEWDISCNTYIHDSTKVDSSLATTASHTISNFSGTTLDYSITPTNTYYRTLQSNVVLNSIVSETQSTIGNGMTTTTSPIPTIAQNGKSQYLFTASELTSAGVTAGDLAGLMLNVLNGTADADFLRVRIKPTTKTSLEAGNPDITGFTEVHFHNTTFTTGMNRIQFANVFTWDGTSNLIVEFSFNNQNGGNAIDFAGDMTGNTMGIMTSNDQMHYFNGSNYIQANYNGIGGNGDRTMEAWINSTVANKEMISWGINSSTEKWSFRINGNGTIRAEVNGGFIYGTTNVDDGQWHHVACVLTGSNIANAQLYVDGVLETVGANQSQTVNTNTTTNVTIGHGRNNTYFSGLMDDVRIWNTTLSATTLQNWMYKKVDNSHPNYGNLELDYRLDEGAGDAIIDFSVNGNNGTVQNVAVWERRRGIDLFKSFENTNERPTITFLQGNYMLSISTDTIYEAIQNTPNVVQERQIFPNYGLMKNDSIGVISTNSYWQAGGYEYYYDENGVLVDSTFITTDGSITPTTLSYMLRRPMKFEIMSFVTPYGINLDLGPNGKTWTFDVTDYAPILKGNKRMTLERGGQWMEDMDIRFVYIVGTPPRDVLDIDQIWRTESRNHTVIMADDYYEPKDMMIHPNGNYFKIRSTITGHGQQGEFIPQAHYLNVNGGLEEFSWQVWTECSENPIFPQGGTWIYDRAGWCPGAPSDIEESDLTPYVTAGQTAEIDYGVYGGSGDTRYIASHQLVAYGAANFTNDAAIVDIISPSDKVEYSKSGVVCSQPTLIIQNTGLTDLTSLTIEYWVNNASTKRTYTWSGSLAFMDKEEVVLPVSEALWADIAGANNTFYAEISNPNGTTDEYSFNNKVTSNFSIPEILPSAFVVQFKTNTQGGENRYALYDDIGTQLFIRQTMLPNTIYNDTFNLAPGCYSLVINDLDDDGIDFWANSDGAGYCRIYRTNIPAILKGLEPDFGGSITYNFTVEFPLTNQLIEKKADVKVFPNPANNYFVVENKQIRNAQIQVYNAVGQQVDLPNFVSDDQVLFKTDNLPKGIYFVNIQIGEKLITKRIIVSE
ncbi:MAG: LamG-like jellyroll fold domain-containing protein [Saprospiraceae bacterium]